MTILDILMPAPRRARLGPYERQPEPRRAAR